MKDIASYTSSDLESYHCHTLRLVPISSLDPSMVFGFHCGTETEFDQFVTSIKQVGLVWVIVIFIFMELRRQYVEGQHRYSLYSRSLRIIKKPKCCRMLMNSKYNTLMFRNCSLYERVSCALVFVLKDHRGQYHLLFPCTMSKSQLTLSIHAYFSPTLLPRLLHLSWKHLKK